MYKLTESLLAKQQAQVMLIKWNNAHATDNVAEREIIICGERIRFAAIKDKEAKRTKVTYSTALNWTKGNNELGWFKIDETGELKTWSKKTHLNVGGELWANFNPNPTRRVKR